MGGGDGNGGRELDQTSTWAVASVCAVIVIISILLEKALHRVGHWIAEKKKTSMIEVFEKVKTELMILGFISLVLTSLTNYISKICIPEKVADTMLPCSLKVDKGYQEEDIVSFSGSNNKCLAVDVYSSGSKGKVPLISHNGIHQLHIFIFFLAVFHLLLSAITMGLGKAKIRGWKDWEEEAATCENESTIDPQQFRLTRETTFVRQHINVWNRVTIPFIISSFLQQFYRSVRKPDYLAMRHGFISAHLAPGSKFDFQKYIRRSLEDDFKVVVGISPVLWASAVVLLLINVQGWMALFWVSLIPPILLLAVGTKLQAIISMMALKINEQHVVTHGAPLVTLNDQHFWFKSPSFILFLIHFTLFLNAFQIIYFLWIWYSFGFDSCLNGDKKLLIIRICLGVVVHLLCSYVTLPLYALVSQLGSQMKRSVFDDHTSQALMEWYESAKKKA